MESSLRRFPQNNPYLTFGLIALATFTFAQPPAGQDFIRGIVRSILLFLSVLPAAPFLSFALFAEDSLNLPKIASIPVSFALGCLPYMLLDAAWRWMGRRAAVRATRAAVPA